MKSVKVSGTLDETCLVVRQWLAWHPHLEGEIENIELLRPNGEVRLYYKISEDVEEHRGLYHCSQTKKTYRLIFDMETKDVS